MSSFETYRIEVSRSVWHSWRRRFQSTSSSFFLFTRDPLRGVQKRPAYPLKGIQKWPRLLSQRSRCRKTVHQNMNDNKYPEYCKKCKRFWKLTKLWNDIVKAIQCFTNASKLCSRDSFVVKSALIRIGRGRFQTESEKKSKERQFRQERGPIEKNCLHVENFQRAKKKRPFPKSKDRSAKKSREHHRDNCSFVTLPRPCNPCTRSLWTCERDLCG